MVASCSLCVSELHLFLSGSEGVLQPVTDESLGLPVATTAVAVRTLIGKPAQASLSSPIKAALQVQLTDVTAHNASCGAVNWRLLPTHPPYYVTCSNSAQWGPGCIASPQLQQTYSFVQDCDPQGASNTAGA